MKGTTITRAENERKIIQILKKRHGSAYRAWFSDSLLDQGWRTVNRNGLRFLKSPKEKVVDPFRGYRRSVRRALFKINEPGFYFILNWEVIPTQGKLYRLRGIIKRFGEKEIHLFRLRRLGVWFVLVGKKDTTSTVVAKRKSIDKKYFEVIYEADERDALFIEADIDIHSHPEDLDVSSEDRNYAKGADPLKRFFITTYQEGFAPFTSRGRVRDSKRQKIVIPWNRIRQELRRI